MIIQYISDCHLEQWGYDTFDVHGDILVLSGDIGNPYSQIYLDFLNYCNINWKYVILITGNHEYYQKRKRIGVFDIDKHIKSLCDSLDNIYFLQNSYVEIDNYIFYGTTLWSNIPKQYAPIIEYKLNDYDKIHYITTEFPYTPCYLTTKFSNLLHKNSITSLEQFLFNNKTSDKKIIIISHHCPSFKAHTSHNDIKYAFCTDLDYIFHKYNMPLWIFGHTHEKINITINNTLIVSNPRGYPGELYDHSSNYMPISTINI